MEMVDYTFSFENSEIFLIDSQISSESLSSSLDNENINSSINSIIFEPEQ